MPATAAPAIVVRPLLPIVPRSTTTATEKGVSSPVLRLVAKLKISIELVLMSGDGS